MKTLECRVNQTGTWVGLFQCPTSGLRLRHLPVQKPCFLETGGDVPQPLTSRTQHKNALAPWLGSTKEKHNKGNRKYIENPDFKKKLGSPRGIG